MISMIKKYLHLRRSGFNRKQAFAIALKWVMP